MNGEEHRVFISFATPDKDAAWSVCQALEERGYDCWISLRDIETGSSYGDEIVRQIRTSSALVLVLSDAANDSEFVHREVERAINYRSPVFPVRVEDVLPAPTLELFVSANQWIDVWDGEFSDQMDRLAGDLERRRRRFEDEEDAEARTGLSSGTSTGPKRAPSGVGKSRGSGSPWPWVRKYGGFVAAAAVLAVFAILNLPGGSSSTEAGPSPPDTAGQVTSDDTAPNGAVPDPEPETASGTGERTTETGPDEVISSTPAPGSAAGARPEASPGDERDSEERPAADAVLVAVYGSAAPEADAVEGILLSELSDRGLRSLDRLAVPSPGPAPLGMQQLGTLRDAGGVAVLVVGDLQVETVQSMARRFTARATLSVRAYDTESRRLLGTYTFRVGDGRTPGKVGASRMAASSAAATQVAHQAAARLSRDITKEMPR